MAALLVWSRVAIINAIAGYAGGILIVKMLEACGLQWFGWFAGHNYLLAGMALGAVYFVPSWSSLALAFHRRIGGRLACRRSAALPARLRLGISAAAVSAHHLEHAVLPPTARKIRLPAAHRRHA
jgi:urea transporter